jgi:hypothetical protein
MSKPAVIPGVFTPLADAYPLRLPETFKKLDGPGTKPHVVPNPPPVRMPEATLYVLRNKEKAPATKPTYGMTAPLPL